MSTRIVFNAVIMGTCFLDFVVSIVQILLQHAFSFIQFLVTLHFVSKVRGVESQIDEALRRQSLKVSTSAPGDRGYQRFDGQYDSEDEEDPNRARIKVDTSLFEINFSEVKLLDHVATGGSGAMVFRGQLGASAEPVAVKIFATRMMNATE